MGKTVLWTAVSWEYFLEDFVFLLLLFFHAVMQFVGYWNCYTVTYSVKLVLDWLVMFTSINIVWFILDQVFLSGFP